MPPFEADATVMTIGAAGCRQNQGQRPGNPQPNEFDRRRLERALHERRRYRYVKPVVTPVRDGYEITSPCCSRNVDKEGGTVDVARLYYLPEVRRWWLYRKDHAQGQWIYYDAYVLLDEALAVLNEDKERLFWQ